MTGFVSEESSHYGAAKSIDSNDNLEEPNSFRFKWYFSSKEIEESSPSRRDGIDLKKEIYLRKSYCTFLQDLGMRLKVPQVTIATAIVFCHRFFLRQSHAKNDRRTIATVCMFLAGKVEETPRSLKDVIMVSYEIINKKDPSAAQRIKQKEVYEEQKELILIGERLVLATLGFDMNVCHPYKPLVEAIKKFKVAQNALAQVAWNFVNDGLRTSLCLQYRPHHIAAGAIFLAAKFLKVKLPSDGEKVWWQEFDVTPRQLEDVSNQMLELYEQNRAGQTSHTGEVEERSGDGSHQPVITTSTVTESSVSVNVPVRTAGVTNSSQGVQLTASSHADSNHFEFQSAHKQYEENKSMLNGSGVGGYHTNSKSNEHLLPEKEGFREINLQTSSFSKSTPDIPSRDMAENDKSKLIEGMERKKEGQIGFSPANAVTRIDKDKVKAALEKRRRLREEGSRKNDIMDEDDLIERELENGVEFSVDNRKVEQIKQERRHSWPKPINRQMPDDQGVEFAGSKTMKIIKGSDQQHLNVKFKLIESGDKNLENIGHYIDLGNTEEGELSSLDEKEFTSPKSDSISRKAASNQWSAEEYGAARPDSLKRKRNIDHEYPSKLVGDRVNGYGKAL